MKLNLFRLFFYFSNWKFRMLFDFFYFLSYFFILLCISFDTFRFLYYWNKQMSQLKEVYKFFFDYFKLFKSSISLNVSKWTLTDLSSAFKWSLQVEDLFAHLKNKSYFGQFLDDLECLKNHWNIEEGSQLLTSNASSLLKKVCVYFPKIIKWIGTL